MGSDTRWYQGNSFALIIAACLCLSCLMLACSGITLASLDSRPADRIGAMDVIPLCAWARNGNVGLWWNSRVAPATAFAVSRRYNAVCVAMPWTTVLPERGRPSLDVSP